MQRHPEARPGRARVAVVLVLRCAHGLEPLGQRQRVAVVAARGDAVAPGGGVPRGLGPLDRPRSAIVAVSFPRQPARVYVDVPSEVQAGLIDVDRGFIDERFGTSESPALDHARKPPSPRQIRGDMPTGGPHAEAPSRRARAARLAVGPAPISLLNLICPASAPTKSSQPSRNQQRYRILPGHA